MKHHVRTFACVVALLIAGCGGKQTMASKSAAAFDAAGGHVEHAAAEPPAVTAMADEHATMPGTDHSTMPMPGVDHTKMPGMDHTKMARMDHTKMARMDHTKMAGMDHTKMPAMDHSTMAGMDHSTMPGMQHGASTKASAVIAPPITHTQPGALRPDEFDAPAPSSVEEAAKGHHGGTT